MSAKRSRLSAEGEGATPAVSRPHTPALPRLNKRCSVWLVVEGNLVYAVCATRVVALQYRAREWPDAGEQRLISIIRAKVWLSADVMPPAEEIEVLSL